VIARFARAAACAVLVAGCSRGSTLEGSGGGDGGAFGSIPPPASGANVGPSPVDLAGADAASDAADCPEGAICGNMWGETIGGPFPWMNPGDAGPRRASPKVRQGPVTVSSGLPPEVVQRIVRQNFGRFRLCYENGLRSDPALAGRVTVQFIIGSAGDVVSAADGGSTLGDPSVVACIVRGFGNLSFPSPDAGRRVLVSFPIDFAPGSP
jgi:hypothetical protein